MAQADQVVVEDDQAMQANLTMQADQVLWTYWVLQADLSPALTHSGDQDHPGLPVPCLCAGANTATNSITLCDGAVITLSMHWVLTLLDTIGCKGAT